MPQNVAAQILALDIDRSTGQIVVRCRGKLVAGVIAYFDGEIRQLIPGATQIMLDLTDLSAVDSMGLGAIVRLYVSAKSTGCNLQLINFGQRIRKLLSITNLLPILGTIGGTGIANF